MSVFQSVAPSNMLSSGLSVCARVGEPGQAAQCHDRLTKDPRVIQKDCPLWWLSSRQPRKQLLSSKPPRF